MKDRLEAIAEKVLTGERLSAEDGLYLFEEGDLIDTAMLAHTVKERLHPESYVTYIIDQNINYTNICVATCDFCAFHEPVNSVKGYVLSKDQIRQKITETLDLGGTQILMQGGLNPALKIGFFEELFQYIRDTFPQVRIHSLSPPEITYLARISGLTVDETVKRLKKAGLASVPGGGAEILVDEVRKKLNANKCNTGEWLKVMETAHHNGMRTTATMMFGHIESREHRIEHFLRIRELQDKTGGFTAFIPWTFQPENTRVAVEETSAHDYLKTLAISRLMLDNIPNIQVSWVTMGPRIAQVALRFGGNDFGSLMIEENVVAAAGAAFRMSLDEIRRLISDAGYVPRQRDMEYNLLH
jgi:cyclic dehypoxanthinyl futalosine synthase